MGELPCRHPLGRLRRGILNPGTLTVSGCTISGIIYGTVGEGGGIFNDGTLTVSGCSISGSYADGSDADRSGASGAGIANWGTALKHHSFESPYDSCSCCPGDVS